MLNYLISMVLVLLTGDLPLTTIVRLDDPVYAYVFDIHEALYTIGLI